MEDLPVHFLGDGYAAGPTDIRQEMERDLIVRTLQSTKYNRSRTADILNMSRKTLYSKMTKYGLNA
jgi:two-component system response regulator HydG